MTRNFTSHRHTLKPGSLEAVAQWAAEMNGRKEEASVSMRNEGVRLELVLLESTEQGDYLIFVLDTDDYARAVEIYQSSTHPIDVFHREFLKEHVITSQKLQVLVSDELIDGV